MVSLPISWQPCQPARPAAAAGPLQPTQRILGCIDPQQPTLCRSGIDRFGHVRQPPRSIFVDRAGEISPHVQAPPSLLQSLTCARSAPSDEASCAHSCTTAAARPCRISVGGVADASNLSPLLPTQMLSQCRVSDLGVAVSPRPSNGSPAAGPSSPEAAAVPKVAVPVGGMHYQVRHESPSPQSTSQARRATSLLVVNHSPRHGGRDSDRPAPDPADRGTPFCPPQLSAGIKPSNHGG